MNMRKYNNAVKHYTGHTGPVTLQAVLDQIPADLCAELTGRHLGMVMSVVNNAYHNGKSER